MFCYKDLSQIDEQSKESSTPIGSRVKIDVALNTLAPFDFVGGDYERINCGTV